MAQLLQDLGTSVVAPLRPLQKLPPIGRLRPEIAIERQRFRLIVDRLVAVRPQVLTERIGSAEPASESIRRAMDELLCGV